MRRMYVSKNVVLDWDSESEPRTISQRLFQSLGAKRPPLVDLDILGMTRRF